MSTDDPIAAARHEELPPPAPGGQHVQSKPTCSCGWQEASRAQLWKHQTEALRAVIEDRDREVIKWKNACLDWQLKWTDECERRREDCEDRDREIGRLRAALSEKEYWGHRC